MQQLPHQFQINGMWVPYQTEHYLESKKTIAEDRRREKQIIKNIKSHKQASLGNTNSTLKGSFVSSQQNQKLLIRPELKMIHQPQSKDHMIGYLQKKVIDSENYQDGPKLRFTAKGSPSNGKESSHWHFNPVHVKINLNDKELTNRKIDHSLDRKELGDSFSTKLNKGSFLKTSNSQNRLIEFSKQVKDIEQKIDKASSSIHTVNISSKANNKPQKSRLSIASELQQFGQISDKSTIQQKNLNSIFDIIDQSLQTFEIQEAINQRSSKMSTEQSKIHIFSKQQLTKKALGFEQLHKSSVSLPKSSFDLTKPTQTQSDESGMSYYRLKISKLLEEVQKRSFTELRRKNNNQDQCQSLKLLTKGKQNMKKKMQEKIIQSIIRHEANSNYFSSSKQRFSQRTNLPSLPSTDLIIPNRNQTLSQNHLSTLLPQIPNTIGPPSMSNERMQVGLIQNLERKKRFERVLETDRKEEKKINDLKTISQHNDNDNTLSTVNVFTRGDRGESQSIFSKYHHNDTEINQPIHLPSEVYGSNLEPDTEDRSYEDALIYQELKLKADAPFKSDKKETKMQRAQRYDKLSKFQQFKAEQERRLKFQMHKKSAAQAGEEAENLMHQFSDMSRYHHRMSVIKLKATDSHNGSIATIQPSPEKQLETTEKKPRLMKQRSIVSIYEDIYQNIEYKRKEKKKPRPQQLLQNQEIPTTVINTSNLTDRQEQLLLYQKFKQTVDLNEISKMVGVDLDALKNKISAAADLSNSLRRLSKIDIEAEKSKITSTDVLHSQINTHHQSLDPLEKSPNERRKITAKKIQILRQREEEQWDEIRNQITELESSIKRRGTKFLSKDEQAVLRKQLFLQYSPLLKAKKFSSQDSQESSSLSPRSVQTRLKFQKEPVFIDNEIQGQDEYHSPIYRKMRRISISKQMADLMRHSSTESSQDKKEEPFKHDSLADCPPSLVKALKKYIRLKTDTESDDSDQQHILVTENNDSQINVSQNRIKSARDSATSLTSDIQLLRERTFFNFEDKAQGLEYNGGDIPEDYLVAKFSFNNQQKTDFKQQTKYLEEETGKMNSTAYNFHQGSVFTVSASSFNHPDYSLIDPIQAEEGLKDILNDFLKKKEFLIEVRKNNVNKNKQVNHNREIFNKFVETTYQQNCIPLPVLLKIKKGILYLPSTYSISEGLSQAMRDVLPLVNEEGEFKIEKAVLVNNKMTDKMLANILIGLRSKADFYSLSIQGSCVGDEAATQICNLISRKNNDPFIEQCQYPPVLHELKLANVKMAPRSLDRVLELLIQQSFLKQLQLKKLNMSDRQMKTAIKVVREVRLSELDLSWNKMSLSNLYDLFTVLESNKSLQNLNLSWIKMTGVGEADEKKADRKLFEKFFLKFCTFIKENSKLIHLNMTAVGLPQEQLGDLIDNIKRSQSLHCVHLCGNNLSPENNELMQKRLKFKSIQRFRLDPKMKDEKDKLVAQIQMGLRKNFKQKFEQIYDARAVKEALIEWESVRERYDNSLTLQEEDEANSKIKPSFSPLILSKHLGHLEIANGKHWKLMDECYFCDKWKYSLIFWDLKTTGVRNQIRDTELEMLIENLVSQSSSILKHLHKSQLLSKSSPLVYITGSFTNWEPRRMLQIDQLLGYFQGKHDALQQIDRRRFLDNQNKTRWRTILNESRQYDGDNCQIFDMPHSDLFNEYNPPEIDFNQLFVFPCFIKPGKHDYIVTYEHHLVQQPPPAPPSPTSAQLKLNNAMKRLLGNQPEVQEIKEVFVPEERTVKLASYHQLLGNAYLGEYRINTKKNEFNEMNRIFDKDNSVFKEWRLDNNKSLRKGFEEEIQYWKVPNFVKDEAECTKIAAYMMDNIEFLKSLFIIKSAQSYWPTIRWLNYAPMVQEWNILGEDFEIGAVDRIFIAVTKNMDKQLLGILPEKDMSRFQFYESLVRIAYFKFKLNNHTETTLQAVEKLIGQILVPRYDNWLWMGWRKQKLWTLEIDDLYKSNLPPMQKLYKYYFIAKKVKTMYLEDAVMLLTREAGFDLLPEQISQCWGLSKMSCNNDITLRKLYQECTFVEFLEFFARIAEMKFKEGPLKHSSLQEKIENLMDILFPLVNSKRKEVLIETEYQSVSEEEMDELKYFI